MMIKKSDGADVCRKRRLLGSTGLLLVAALISTAGNSPAYAQQLPASQREAQIAFNIPAQDMNSAVLAFARRAGVRVFYDTTKLRGQQSRGVTGSMSPQAALGQILAGSGLDYRFNGPRAVTIGSPQTSAAAAAVAGSTALDPIEVQGKQSPTGPGDGFVAQTSQAGSKTNTSLIENPQTISVTTRGQLDAQQATNLTQAARYIPGVYFGDNTDTRNEYFKARGYTLDQYQDGLKLLTQGAWIENKIDPFFLDRIEVLQGPSSGLYGQSSPGGLVNFVSKRPTSTPFGQIQLQTGSYGRIQGAFDIGGPVTQDGTLLYRLTGLGRSTGTQVDDMHEQRVAIAPAVTWKPDANTSLTILASYVNDPEGGFWSSLPYLGTLLYNTALPGGKIPRNLNTGQPNYELFKRERSSIGYEFEHRFDEIFTVRQNFRYSHVESTYNALQAYMFNTGTSILQRDNYRYQGSADTASVDNQVQADFTTGPLRHTVLAGLDYQYVNRNDFSRYGAGPNLDVLAPNYNLPISLPNVNLNREQTFNQLGAYLQDQIKLDRFIFTFTGRQDWAWAVSNDRRLFKRTEQEDSAFTGRAGVSYLFDSGVAPYFSYSTSFNPAVIASAISFDGSAFKPTTGKQYEAGIKYQPVGWNALFTVAAFDLTQQNVLTSDPLHPVGGYSVQTGEIRTRGFEVSGVGNLTSELSVQASYTYLDPEITNDTKLAGKAPANVPHNLAKLWVDYAFKSGPLGGLGLGGGVRYIGETFANTTNLNTIPDYALFDLAVRYDLSYFDPKLKGWNVAVNAANLFDKIYVSDCSDISCRWGQGRTVYGTLGYKW